jgi:hypothetical protein
LLGLEGAEVDRGSRRRLGQSGGVHGELLAWWETVAAAAARTAGWSFFADRALAFQFRNWSAAAKAAAKALRQRAFSSRRSSGANFVLQFL